jgi:hypothetical protein
LLPGPCLTRLTLEGCPLGRLAAPGSSGSSSSSSSSGSSSSGSGSNNSSSSDATSAAAAEAAGLVAALVAARGPEVLSLAKCWALGEHRTPALQSPARSAELRRRGGKFPPPPPLSSMVDLLQQASEAAGAAAAPADEAAAAAPAPGSVATADLGSDASRSSAVPPFVAGREALSAAREEPLGVAAGWAALQSLELAVPLAAAARAFAAPGQGAAATRLCHPSRDAAAGDVASLFGNFGLGGAPLAPPPALAPFAPARLAYSDLLALGLSPPEAQAALVAVQGDEDASGWFGPDDEAELSGADVARMQPGVALRLEEELTDFLEVRVGRLCWFSFSSSSCAYFCCSPVYSASSLQARLLLSKHALILFLSERTRPLRMVPAGVRVSSGSF